MQTGFPLQNVMFFVVTSSIVGGWLDIRCVKTKRLIRSKSFTNTEELENLKQAAVNDVISAAITKELGL